MCVCVRERGSEDVSARERSYSSSDWKMLAAWFSVSSVTLKARATWWFSRTDLRGGEGEEEHGYMHVVQCTCIYTYARTCILTLNTHTHTH